jgi:hypothetical protein
MAMPNLQKIEKASVQEHVNAQKNEAPADFWFEGSARTELLAPYGSAQRKRDLLNYYRHTYNGLVQSAFAGMTKKWAGIDWRIRGKRNRERFEQVFQSADFGAGFESFRQKVGLDFLRFDDGAYIELIFPGNPLRPPTGPLLSIAHLPNLRCVPTGDPAFPVLYVDRRGKRHLLHHTRVIHLVDAPDGDDSYPGYGLCALSRAIALAAQQIHMMRYIEAKLDDKPSPGYMVASNINMAQKHKAFEVYRQEQGNDTRPEWGKTIWFYSVDPTAPASIKPVSYSEAPEAFNYKEYMEIHVNALALALGVDVQELWQLTGGTLGSGQQSMVLHAKSQNKTFAAFLEAFEPKLNAALPGYADFEFVVRDPYAIQDEAMSAQAWAGAVSTANKYFHIDEVRAILASQSPAIRDEIANPDGSLKPGPTPQEQDSAPDENPPQTDGPRTDAEVPRQMAALERRIGERKEVKAEDEPADETPQQAFEREFAALLDDVEAGILTEVMLRARLRALLQRYGYAAYREALAAVDEARELSESDNRALLLLLAALAPFVRKFAFDLFALNGEARAVRAVALKSHGELWWNKSVREFAYEAAYRADPEQMMTFTGEDGLESCDDCQRLKGVTRPMWWWKATRQRPGTDSDSFDCGGWRCQHFLAAA